jgi:hypothetical protein
MTTSTLISKLNKMNIESTIVDDNGYNMDVKFIINGMTFKAGFIKGQNVIQDFCREIYFDKSNQETQRRFFDNFNKLLKYTTN